MNKYLPVSPDFLSLGTSTTCQLMRCSQPFHVNTYLDVGEVDRLSHWCPRQLSVMKSLVHSAGPVVQLGRLFVAFVAETSVINVNSARCVLCGPQVGIELLECRVGICS